MRRIVLATFAMLLILTGTAAAKDRSGKLAYRTVQSGTSSFIQSSQPRAFIGWNETDYEAFWSALVGPSKPPKIDFKKERPVLLCAGAQPTAGYDIHVDSAHFDRDMIVVIAPIVPPSPRSRVAQVITYPYVLIAVPTKKGRKVRWLDRGGRDIELTGGGGPATQ